MTMVQLSQSLAGVHFANPLIVASGPLTANLDRLKRAEDAGAAAVSIKHIMYHQPFQVKPRWYVDRKLGMIVSGDPRLTIEQGQELISKAKEQTKLVILANMSGLANDLATWATTAKSLVQAGADIIEINFNCPNLAPSQAQSGGKPALFGANVGSDPELCASIVRAIKEAVPVPVVPKLTSEGGRLVEVGLACVAAGADFLNVHAGFRAAPGLDIYNGGRLLYPGLENGNLAGFSGPWSRLISYRFVAEVAMRTSVPIMGGGGLMEWRHIVESIMYGSSLVQVCTAIMWHGYGVITEMLRGLQTFMEETGYHSIEEMRGLALRYIAEPRQLKYLDTHAHVNAERCNGCGLCTRIGCCDALEMVGKTVVVHEDRCVSCGLCRGICNRGAIEIY